MSLISISLPEQTEKTIKQSALKLFIYQDCEMQYVCNGVVLYHPTKDNHGVLRVVTIKNYTEKQLYIKLYNKSKELDEYVELENDRWVIEDNIAIYNDFHFSGCKQYELIALPIDKFIAPNVNFTSASTAILPTYSQDTNNITLNEISLSKLTTNNYLDGTPIYNIIQDINSGSKRINLIGLVDKQSNKSIPLTSLKDIHTILSSNEAITEKDKKLDYIISSGVELDNQNISDEEKLKIAKIVKEFFSEFRRARERTIYTQEELDNTAKVIKQAEDNARIAMEEEQKAEDNARIAMEEGQKAEDNARIAMEECKKALKAIGELLANEETTASATNFINQYIDKINEYYENNKENIDKLYSAIQNFREKILPSNALQFQNLNYHLNQLEISLLAQECYIALELKNLAESITQIRDNVSIILEQIKNSNQR